MSGRLVAGGLVGAALLIGALLWWAQNWAWYRDVEGVDNVLIGDLALPVTEYRGVDADSSPIRMRGCFAYDPADLDAARAAAAKLTEAFRAAGARATPLTSPARLDCFDAAAIGAAIEAGEAEVLVASREEAEGVDRIVALWPDGRGVTWRQLNETWAE